jgi:hypothetical protein
VKAHPFRLWMHTVLPSGSCTDAECNFIDFHGLFSVGLAFQRSRNHSGMSTANDNERQRTTAKETAGRGECGSKPARSPAAHNNILGALSFSPYRSLALSVVCLFGGKTESLTLLSQPVTRPCNKMSICCFRSSIVKKSGPLVFRRFNLLRSVSF